MTYKHNGGTVDELNELLRALARYAHSDTSIAEEAADALEAAQAKIERLVEALEMCLETEERPGVIDIARAALAAAKQPAST